MSNFVLDANCFIQAHRSIYPIDVASSFWEKLKDLADREIIVSIDKVYDELFENEDELTDWIDTHLDDSFFRETETDSVLAQYQQVVSWAQSKSDQYLPGAITEFMEYDNADAWLVAYAKVTNQTLVTYEVSSPNSQTKIKIPDVCNAFNIPCVNTIEMLRDLSETF
ncbi:DUF4411 family protein [Aliifodinibius sp. S!AR15-10]|uniref:DUF4411 family protein n=1 Tax=Aliifodinibius sp. S!AR15-10 TaxID=2950437 RepID=UPI0028655B2C|nr:DUF4411 family protein [Aliifodinibius sp. S!AR15-10]MDR8389906.1 DUF4411 family protein [Aliifodinibius sp. S!AR15-10]